MNAHTRTDPARRCVAIAGATGFVGTALLSALGTDWRIIGLTRSGSRAAGPSEDVEWRRCDLFYLPDVSSALRGCEAAVYLVHSMLPSSRLTQARFEDLDLLMADTFRRAAEAAGVEHIVFLSGLAPEGQDLSRHLASRIEVEDALAAGPVPVTVLRAGLIVGPGGSSFQLMANLVRRLPAMILPRWTRSRTQPIALRDVVRAIRIVLEEPDRVRSGARGSNESPPGGAVRIDLGGPDEMTYKEMLRRTAVQLGRRPVMLDVRAFSPRLSVAWVSLFGGAPRALVGPLVQSLRHDMVAGPSSLHDRLAPDLVGFEQAVRDSLDESGRLEDDPRTSRRAGDAIEIRRRARVRSVQRFPLPHGRTAGWVAREYFRWLPRFARPWIRVSCGPRGTFDLVLAPGRVLLLRLARDAAGSAPGRVVYRIAGGALARAPGDRDRTEFLATPDGSEVLVAVHDFQPRLPWLLYAATQARAHRLVMRGFGRHLQAQAESRRDRTGTARPEAGL